MIGRIVGNYKIIEKIGEGGMGAVYRGIDLMLERDVAIKVLRSELANQPQVVERFRSEAVTLAKLNHPNIAALYSFFRQGDDFFMVMEYLQGKTLDRVLAERGRIPYREAIPLFCHALEGVGYAHRRGVIHRDIKPANMMLTDEGVLKVMDFGIARVLGTARMTRAGHLIGTIEYMSPEQVRGLETDARSDIYSLGMLLYEILTGRVPFAIENEFELMHAQIERMPTPPRQIVAEIPEPIEEAIMRAIAKDPADRWSSAMEFRTALLKDETLTFSPAQGIASTTFGDVARNDSSEHATTSSVIKPTVIAPRAQSAEAVRETRLAGWTAPSEPASPASIWKPKRIAIAGGLAAFVLLLLVPLAILLSLGARNTNSGVDRTTSSDSTPKVQPAQPSASPAAATSETKGPELPAAPALPPIEELKKLKKLEEVASSGQEATQANADQRENKRPTKQQTRTPQEKRTQTQRRRLSHEQQVEELMRLP